MICGGASFDGILLKLIIKNIGSPDTGDDGPRAAIEAIIGPLEAQDRLSTDDISDIRARRSEARDRLEEALQGDDLTKIKAAYSDLRATDTEAQMARAALAAQLRQKVQTSIHRGIASLHSQASSPAEFETKLMEIADMLIERAAKLD